jgi:protein subunit release factor B
VPILEIQRFLSPKDTKSSIRIRLRVEKEQEHDSEKRNKRQLIRSKEMRRLSGKPSTMTHDSRQNRNRFLAEVYHINGAELPSSSICRFGN